MKTRKLTVCIVILKDVVHVIGFKMAVTVGVGGVPQRGHLCADDAFELLQGWLGVVTLKNTLFEKGITFECIFRRILSLLVYRVTVDILKRNRMNFKDKERDRVSNQTIETKRNVYIDED